MVLVCPRDLCESNGIREMSIPETAMDIHWQMGAQLPPQAARKAKEEIGMDRCHRLCCSDGREQCMLLPWHCTTVLTSFL